MAQTATAELPGALTGSLLVKLGPDLKKCEADVACVSTAVCTTDRGNTQLIMALHTKGMFPVGRSSFREKFNFRLAMDKAADMC